MDKLINLWCAGSVGSARAPKTEKTRRGWTEKEEEVLLASLKELVAQGWKSDNGFRPGYIGKLEASMRKEFPHTDLKGTPHITSRLTSWKKNYSSLVSILNRSGVGFNVNGDFKVEANLDQWDQIYLVLIFLLQFMSMHFFAFSFYNTRF